VQESLSVLLVYESVEGRSIAIARVDNRSLLLRVAEMAVGEAQARAELLKSADTVLGAVEREEADRLERVLTFLVPELGQVT
jgi:hypothetical protein